MSNLDDSFHFIQPQVRPNKNLVYNGKKYPVDFNLMKQYSNYFFENQNKYNSIEEIEISEENIQITDDVFQNFVQCCQNQKFPLSDTNAYPLYQLSIKYDVPDLKNLVNNYIDENNQKLVFKIINFKLNCLQDEDQNPAQIDLTEEESKIASNLLQYINNDEIFSLPIQVLYRILNNYGFNLNEMNQTNQKQVIEFLFKCLDKIGKSASVLFLNLNFNNNLIELYSRLNHQYSDKFDFNMINPNFLLKTTNELLSELNKLKIEYSDSISEIKKLIQSQNEQIKSQTDHINQLKKSIEDQISQQNESFTKTKNDIKSQVDQQLSGFSSKFNLTENDLKSQFSNQLNSLNSKLSQTENDMKNRINQQLDNFNSKLSQATNDLERKISQQSDSFNSKISQTENNLKNRINQESGNFNTKLSQSENSIRSYVQSNFAQKQIQIIIINHISNYFNLPNFSFYFLIRLKFLFK